MTVSSGLAEGGTWQLVKFVQQTFAFVSSVPDPEVGMGCRHPPDADPAPGSSQGLGAQADNSRATR